MPATYNYWVERLRRACGALGQGTGPLQDRLGDAYRHMAFPPISSVPPDDQVAYNAWLSELKSLSTLSDADQQRLAGQVLDWLTNLAYEGARHVPGE
jgi:hypothetical protein